MVQVDKHQNIWWLLDPYYNKVIPQNLETIQTQSELARTHYADLPNVDTLLKIYHPPGNQTYPTTQSYTGWKKYYIERLSYIFIWIIPLICVLVATRDSWPFLAPKPIPQSHVRSNP